MVERKGSRALDARGWMRPRLALRSLLGLLSITLAGGYLTSLGGLTVGAAELQVGLAETEITPPDGLPMAGYFHERLATGQLDPLKAKAVVFRGADQQAALVMCDLTGIAVDLSREVRRLAAERTGIPAANITVAATHSHTAPDYYRALYDYLRGVRTDPARAAYVEQLIERTVAAIEAASRSARGVTLASGAVEQQTPVAFNRRFVMRDGSVRTWMNLKNPDTIRPAGPIDPQIGLLHVQDAGGTSLGLISNFALHLDTVGGLKWSGDYPYFIERAVRQSLGPEVVSLFGTGCCGDINHANPTGAERNKTDVIGGSLGATIQAGIGQLRPLVNPQLQVRSAVVPLPLQEASSEAVAQAIQVMRAVQAGEPVEFLTHVAAHKTLLVDRLRNTPPHAGPQDPQSLLLTHAWAGSGAQLPTEVQVICLGEDLAIVCLPGEVFVDLGLAIKQASPFRTTLIIELANSVETCYIPTRAAYAGGSYEVTHSTVAAGAGEMLVEAALSLLRDARSAPHHSP